MLTTLVTIIASSACLVQAIPQSTSGLSLIKTTLSDPGTWVTDSEKLAYIANGTHIIDITDITDPDVLHILSTSSDDQLSNLARRAITYPTNVSHRAEADPLVAKVTVDQPKAWMKTMSDMFNRHYLHPEHGPASAAWMFSTAKSVAAPNPAIRVTQFPHTKFDQPTVIVQIPGKKSDLVIIGAHYDSRGGGPEDRGPGAVDNASGVAALLEALHHLATTKFAPQATLEFHFYGGEEGGFLGAKDVFARYKADAKTVLGFLNQDMAAYSPSGMISIYTDYVDMPWTNYVRMVATAYTGETSSSRCGEPCGDHVPARSNGFREFFP